MKPEAKGSCWSRFLDKVDIFSYIPVPQSFPVSTRNSKIGSLIVIILFLVYLIYDFVQFITSNVPSVNTYPVLVSDQVSKTLRSLLLCQQSPLVLSMGQPSIKPSPTKATLISRYSTDRPKSKLQQYIDDLELQSIMVGPNGNKLLPELILH
jgi:hypothetical protein